MTAETKVKTELTEAEALEAIRLAQEAVYLAANAVEQAEKDLNDAYIALSNANAARRIAKLGPRRRKRVAGAEG